MNLGKIPGMQVKTSYDFKLTRKGKLLQHVQPHNVTCSYISQVFKSAENNTGPTTTPSTLMLGTGTAEPSSTDTSLGNLLWYIRPTSHSVVPVTNGAKLSQTFVFPATSAYVGIITEAGLGCSNYNRGSVIASTGYLATHCLLKDAEGNPISIEKTALDILTVTAEVTYLFTAGTLCDAMLSDNLLATHFPYDTDYGDIVSLFAFAGLTYAMGLTGLYTSTCHNVINQQLLYYDAAQNKVATNNTQRLGVDDGNNQYYNSIAIGSVGLINFPNPDIFPNYDITGISVGIGDGTTTQWNNPLAYFVANSDRVYVDGVLQTRGVDYTIDNVQNSQMMQSVCFDLLKGAFTSFYPHTSSNSQSYLGSIPFVGAGILYPTDTLNNPRSIAVGKEIVIKCAAPYKVNRFVMSGLQQKYYNNPCDTSCTISLWYSDDGTVWTKACTEACSGSFDVTLESSITALYWKIVCDAASYSSTEYPVLFNGSSFLGWVGNPLTFTTPPAEGAVITMDVSMDRPYKNSNFVIDTSYSLQFVDA